MSSDHNRNHVVGPSSFSLFQMVGNSTAKLTRRNEECWRCTYYLVALFSY